MARSPMLKKPKQAPNSDGMCYCLRQSRPAQMVSCFLISR